MEKSFKDKFGIADKWFYLTIFLLGVYLVIRLLDQAKIIFLFPLDYTNDVSAYMAILHFLKVYGFHNIAPNWYNGLIVLKFYSPAWFFLVLPLYSLTKNIQLTVYLSLLMLLAIGFILTWLIGREYRLSAVKRIAFFLLVFANPISIGSFIRLGRLPSLLGFIVAVLGSFLIISHYKNKKLDVKFGIIFSILCAINILSHPQETLLSLFILLGFFITRNYKEKLIIAVCGALSILMSSFWLIPFLRDMGQGTITDYVYTSRLFQFTSEWLLMNVSGFIAVFSLWLFFYLHAKSEPKQIKLFLPVIILSVLYIFRVIYLIPVFNQVFPENYNLFFAFFAVFFLLRLKHAGQLNKKIIIAGIIIVSILCVLISHFHTPYFAKDSAISKEMREIAPLIKEKYLIAGIDGNLSYSRAYYSYAAIYYNLSTPDGWSTHEIPRDIDALLKKLKQDIQNKECAETRQTLSKLNAREIISHRYCEFFEKCGFPEKIKKEHVCVYGT